MPTIARRGSARAPSGQRILPQVQTPRDSLEEAGAGIISAADEIGRRIDAAETTEANLRLAEFEGEQKRLQFESQQAATGGAAGYADGEIERYDSEAQDFIQSLPPRLQDQARLQVQRIRNGLDLNNRIFEENARAKHQEDNLNGILEVHMDMLATDPGGLEASADFIENAINQSELREDVKAKMRDQAFEALFATASAGFLSNPREFRKALASDRYDRYTQGDQKAKAIADADREVKRLDREARQEARLNAAIEKAEVLNLFKAEKAAIRAGEGSQGLLTAERISRAYADSPETARRLSTEFAMLQQVGDQITDLAMMTAQERADFALSLPQIEGQDADLKADARNLGLAALEAVEKSIHDDPALHVLRHSTDLRERFRAIEGAADDADRRRLTSEATAALMQAQADILPPGRSPRAMTKQQAVDTVASVNAQLPREGGAALFSILDERGDLGPQVLNELRQAKLSDLVVASGIAFGVGDQVSAAQLIRAHQTGEAEQKNQMESDVVTDLEKAVLDQARPVLQVFNNGGLASLEIPVRLAGAQALARQKHLEGMSVDDAARASVAAMLAFEPISDTLAVPAGIDVDATELRLEEIQARIRDSDLNLEAAALFSGRPLDDPEILRQYADHLRAHGRWRNSRNGPQLVDEDGRPAVFADGGFIIERWDDITPLTEEQRILRSRQLRQQSHAFGLPERTIEIDLGLTGGLLDRLGASR